MIFLKVVSVSVFLSFRSLSRHPHCSRCRHRRHRRHRRHFHLRDPFQSGNKVLFLSNETPLNKIRLCWEGGLLLLLLLRLLFMLLLLLLMMFQLSSRDRTIPIFLT